MLLPEPFLARLRWVPLAVAGLCVPAIYAPAETPNTTGAQANPHRQLLNQYCMACHNDKLRTAGVSFGGINVDDVSHDGATWEKTLRKLSTGEMPPPGMPRPDVATRAAFTSWLETSLDQAAANHPNPGRPAIHRLNRAEYGNAVRDLLDLDIDTASMLPADDSGYGFDNIADVLSMSPVLLERYMLASRRISRLAVGDPNIRPTVDQYAVPRATGPGDMSQKLQISEDLPFGSRGGIVIHHRFPVDGIYAIRVLMRPTSGVSDDKPSHEIRIPVQAGTREIGITFLDDTTKNESIAPTPKGAAAVAAAAVTASAVKPDEMPAAELDVRLDDARVKLFEIPGYKAAIDSVWIGGPYEIDGPGDTASRKRIFVCHPATSAGEEPCAKTIISTLARRAYRRPVTDADVKPLLGFYETGRKSGNFESGIEHALQAMLVSPDFLFRVERDPASSAPGTAHRVSDIELASRLSFFLWSSIPDDELLKAAESGHLSDPAVLQQQVKRMLADSKSRALVTNFAGQWLYLRNLAMARPDPVAFPEFDSSLRASFEKETDLFLEAIFREDRSVLNLIDSNFTFVNERLARHYGIPNVYGSAFRRVTLTDPNRGGLLGQGAILTVTSYPNRTSVVLRGKWILENILGTPPPPQPANVPDLKNHTADGKLLTMRQQMEMHRANPVCASCHSRMDPLGFSLENFDGVGKWRTKEAGAAIDASGIMPDGTKFEGPAGLRKVLLSHREEIVETVSEKLLTYALGRGLEYYDRPVVRSIARQAARDDYKVSSLVTAIVESTPFQMRRTPEP